MGVSPPTVLFPQTVRGVGVPEWPFTGTALAVFSFPSGSETLMDPGLSVNTPLQSLEQERPVWSPAAPGWAPRAL